jgi:hypothetical protein
MIEQHDPHMKPGVNSDVPVKSNLQLMDIEYKLKLPCDEVQSFDLIT